MDHRSGHSASSEPDPASPKTVSQSLKEYAVITLNREGHIVEWSSGAQKIFGYTREQIKGRHFADLFTPEDQAAGRPAQELRNATNRESAEDQRWHMRKDGGRVFLSGTVCTLQNEAGELTGYSKVARDITSQKLAELQKEALFEREQAAREQAERQWKQLEEIADRIPASVGLVRLPEGVYEFANRMLHEVLRGRNLIGRTVHEAHPEAGRALEVFEQAVKTGTVQTAKDLPVQFGTGANAEVRYFDITYQPISGKNFPYEALLIFAVDVTDRVHSRQLARQRAAAMEEQASLLDLAHDAIMAIRTDGAIEFWNRGAEEMYGWSKQEALGRTIHQLLNTEFPLPLAQIQETLYAEGQWSGELTHRGRGGKEVEVWSRWVLRKGEDGKPSGWLEVTRDVTERKRLEAHLRDTQKMESLGVLAGGIAHDFNNLLVGIMGNISLAQEMLQPSSPLVPLLEEAVEASERAAFLTRQMLAYAGKGHMFVTPVDLSKAVRDAMTLVRGSIPQNVHVELDLAERLPCIAGDALQLQQVAMNLMLNAAEAMGGQSGRMTVRTGVQKIEGGTEDVAYDIGHPAPGYYASIEVEDTGPGIDPSVRPNIFDPFYTTKFTGRGLGLAAVAGIVRALHGAIRVQSDPGRGTSLLVLFPAEEQPLGDENGPADPSAKR